MSGFNNPIIGGGGGLEYPSIHSPNYQPGGPGWSINKDGTAEFSALTLDNGLALFYSPHPGAGNLIYSVADQPGTDRYGNAYFAGATSYNSAAAKAIEDNGAQSFFLRNGNQQLILELSEVVGARTAEFLTVEQVNGDGFALSSIHGSSEVWLFPSGDTTGVVDQQNLAALLSITPLTVRLLPGTYYLNSTVTVGLGQSLLGCRDATTFKLVAAAGAVPAIKIENSGAYSETQFARVHDLTIDLTGAAASGATGLQFGDILQLDIDVAIQDLTPAHANNGVAGVNAFFFTEQSRCRFYINGSGISAPFALSKSGAGTNSLVRGDFDIYLNAFLPASATGVLINGVQLGGGRLRIQGNFNGFAGSGGTAIALANNALITGTDLLWECEWDAGGGGTAPSTLFIPAGSAIQNCYGALGFFNGFRASSSPVGSAFVFTGPIQGDGTLRSTEFYGTAVNLALVNGSTITWAGSVFNAGSAAAVTGIILAAGFADGQILHIFNSGANSITFAAAGSNVAGGAGVSVAAQAAKTFTWSALNSLWFPG